ncbi:hypothetical protein WA016_02305 [Myxococcus stipitatus]
MLPGRGAFVTSSSNAEFESDLNHINSLLHV